MGFTKEIEVRKGFSNVGVRTSTRDRFNKLVEMLNRENKKALGNKAKKLTKDDVLNELISAYEGVGM